VKDRERRLDELRDAARGGASFAGLAGAISGAPLPLPISEQTARRGYYGQPIIKPPVWTWQVPVYFFLGGLTGGAAVLAAAAQLTGGPRQVVLASLWIASAGALVGPLLLVMDLGRPRRFLNMLRIFKPQSPMSIGAWILCAYGGVIFTATLSLQLRFGTAAGAALLLLAAPLGAALATYTGVLIGATVVPVWHTHHRILPLHFGVAAIGSAGALLEVLGFRFSSLVIVGFTAAAAETLLGAWLELRRHGAADRAVRQGRSGAMLRTSAILAGPAALALRACGLTLLSALAFLAGALLSRYGWIEAGRTSAESPDAVLAGQS
jgi:DMSO reductase anchor subunit